MEPSLGTQQAMPIKDVTVSLLQCRNAQHALARYLRSAAACSNSCRTSARAVQMAWPNTSASVALLLRLAEMWKKSCESPTSM